LQRCGAGKRTGRGDDRPSCLFAWPGLYSFSASCVPALRVPPARVSLPWCSSAQRLTVSLAWMPETCGWPVLLRSLTRETGRSEPASIAGTMASSCIHILQETELCLILSLPVSLVNVLAISLRTASIDGCVRHALLCSSAWAQLLARAVGPPTRRWRVDRVRQSGHSQVVSEA
jgi:hypothetical protein